MSSIFLIIGCSGQKNKYSSKSEDLYCSARFLAAKAIAKHIGSERRILSAKHGLIRNSEIVEPYDLSILELSPDDHIAWAKENAQRILKLTKDVDHIVYIGDELYFAEIKKILEKKRNNIFLPLGNVDKKNSVSWLNSWLETQKNLDRVYSLIASYSNNSHLRLRDFSDLRKKNDCPESGVYIFFDKTAKRIFHPEQIRISRIGTHAVSEGSIASLWQRLMTHKGTQDGYGNHRGSIFRSHIGSSIISKNVIDLPSWGSTVMPNVSIREKEMQIEKSVSEYINNNFSVLCINVPGNPSKANDRAYVERNLIALFSSCLHFADPPQTTWLGYCSTNQVIRMSGLWNVNHTSEYVCDQFLEILEKYLAFSSSSTQIIAYNLAPTNWSHNMKMSQQQKTFF